MIAASRLLAALLLMMSALDGIALARRIGDCPDGSFAPALSTTVGLPFEDPSSPDGAVTVRDGTISLGACRATPAAVTVARHRRRWRARWDRCGTFADVHLQLQLGPGGPVCDYLIGVIRYRDASSRRRAFKFPATRVGEP